MPVHESARRLQHSLIPTPPAANAHSVGSETDDLGTTPPTVGQCDGVNAKQSGLPILSHRLRHSSSILAVVLSNDYLYAGTQGGEILVYELATFSRKAVIEGHRGSVLALCLDSENQLLFSSAGDRIVNVWNTETLAQECCLYTSFDVGDIFCVAFSSALQTVYLGAQNTTIQWCPLRDTHTPRSHIHPSLRDDPFFDSAGPGGIRAPKPAAADVTPRHAIGGKVVEIGRTRARHFAHYGYVYCMVLARDGVPESGGREVLITGGGDGVVKLWTLDSENEGAVDEWYSLNDGREEGSSVLSLALDGIFLYTGRAGGEIDVWDLETRQLVRNIKAHRDDVLTICAGGGFLFSAAITGYVRKFDRQYQLKSRLKAHEGRILCSAFANNNGRPIYVTGGNDSSLAIWDITGCTSIAAPTTKTSNEQLLDYVRRFVSYRTVSSDPRHQIDCRRGASYLRSVFRNFGAVTEMLPAIEPLNPVILAKFRGNPATADKRKKILFYGHYDVVAADKAASKWHSDPFTMEGIDGYLYGRGTSDNKGPLIAAIFACAELMAEQALGSDIIFLIEGEEECGSRGFESIVNANKDKIGDVDWILLANSYWLDDEIPCLTYGLRGVIHATIQVESSHPDLHSGVDGSANLDESLKDLVWVLSTLTGKHGEVMIPGFYDPIPKLEKQEEVLYRDITSALIQQNPSLGDPDALAASLMRRWREASLTIHGFQTSGPNNATIIPRLASAALSMRLVPGQESAVVAKALVSYLHAKFNSLISKNTLTVKIEHQAEPWLGDLNNEIYKTLEGAIMDAWGPVLESQPSRQNPLGGNTPVVEQDDEHRGISRSIAIPNGSKLATATRKAKKGASGSQTASSTSTTDHLAELTTRLAAVETNGNGGQTGKSLHMAEIQMLDESAKKPLRTKPLYIREGGSIPAIRFLEKAFDAPAAHLPCGQASDSAHLDNERLRLVNLYKSRDILKTVFRDLPAK
ncbi:Hypothetical protein R9X50_00149900 [Acrodontium crateriforme]|uniref:Glutathione degradosome n=1 Tax=Acrodontium crateriforme TaxID=150365 RepID=A0AAQ3M2K2_9PEZI|nr:Hypothetical protein R9X50_00149900 [Acrodontium crateriforme]